MKKHNFFAGPSILSEFTKEETAKAVMNFADMGLSVMEISHRSKPFVAVMDEAVALVKELLKVPEGYSVLFLQGGASMQFCMVPYNFMNKKAAYLDTGAWSAKAIKEAKLFGDVVEVASSKDANYSYIPKDYEVPADVDYFHFTTNNTIYGTQTKHDPEVSVPMIADMSSDIFSRPIDIAKYDLIYAGAQKNLGPAGATLVIIKNESLDKVDRIIPTILKYSTHVKGESMFNTPPCLSVFASLQTLKWYKSLGGIEAMQQKNEAKAQLLYGELNSNKCFKAVVADPKDRSVMNVCFVMTEGYEDKEATFLDLATSKGIVGIKGHRSVGGFRASIYNGLPIESVQVLVDAMKEFESQQ